MPSNTVNAVMVREVRSRLGLSQEKFAAKLGVTLPTISRWENGRTKPSPLAIQTIRNLMDSMGHEGADLMAKYFAGETP